jgi:hypothetical protein
MISRFSHKTWKVMRSMLLCVILLSLFSGCAGMNRGSLSSGEGGMYGHSYQEGVMQNNILREGYVASVSKSSQDIFSFTRSIFGKTPNSSSDQFVLLDDGVADRVFGDINDSLDTNIFKIYCSEKGGEVFRWSILGDWHAYSGFRGLSKTFFTCEIEQQVRGVLLYEDFGRGPKYLGPSPYNLKLTIGTGKFFSDLIKEYKLEGFASANKMVTIPLAKLIEQKPKTEPTSDKYSLLFYFKNDTRKPVDINILDTYIIFNGKRYNVDFTFRNEPIFWQSYDHISTGLFVGEKNKTMAKLRFTPGQRFFGQVLFAIPGVATLREDDLKNLKFYLDKYECGDFRRISFYELQKNRMKSAVLEPNKAGM